MTRSGLQAEVIEIVDGFRNLVLAHSAYLLGAVALITALYSVADLFVTPAAAFVPNLIVTIYGQFLIVERLLQDRLPDGKGFRRFGSIFGSAFLSGLAILLAAIALVIPAIFLIARWSIAVPAIIAENNSAAESLSTSWDRTAASKLPIFLIYVVATIVWAGTIWLTFAVGDMVPGGNAVALSIVVNALVGGVAVLGWVLSVAIYRRITPDNARFEAVFA